MKFFYVIILFLIFIVVPAYANTEVVEGTDAKNLLAEQKDSAPILSQVNKVFVLKNSGEESVENPDEMSLEAGSYLFISNDEESTVHNIYDTTDHSWVLKKQLPSGVAAIKFEEPGVHELRCAIHPGMKIKVNVIEKKPE